jgi:hypothetical protein
MARMTREALSLGVMAAFVLSLAATDKPKADPNHDSGLNADLALKNVNAASNAPIPTATCTAAMLDGLAKSVSVHETWESDAARSIEILDLPVAAKISRAGIRTNHDDDGWLWLNGLLVKDLYPKGWNITDQSESKNEDHMNRFAARPFFAVLRADARVLPKVAPGGDDFVGGRLAGKLVVSRIDTGAPVCAIPIAAESSSKVSFKTRGITQTTFEKAIQDDFRSQAANALEAATKTIPGYHLSHGY